MFSTRRLDLLSRGGEGGLRSQGNVVQMHGCILDIACIGDVGFGGKIVQTQHRKDGESVLPGLRGAGAAF
jgi:hypothetical protein